MTDDHADHPSASDLPDDELSRRLREAISPAGAAPDEARVQELRARVGGDTATATTAATGSAGRHRRRRLLAVAAGVALLGVGAAIGAVVETAAGRQEDLLARGTPEFEATLTGDGVQVELDGARAPEGRILVLRSPSLPVLPAGEYYELWFLTDGGGAISAGTFHPDDRGRTVVVLHAAVDPRLAGDLEITHETADGDPASSGVVVARGPVELD